MVLLCLCTIASISAPQFGLAARGPAPTSTPYPPAVINLALVPASRAAEILRGIYPHARIRVDESANAVVVIASPDDVNGMRTVVTGIDVKNPTAAVIDTVQLHTISNRDAVSRLRALFKRSRFTAAPNRTVIIAARPVDMTDIKAVVAAIDTAPPTPTPHPVYPAEAVRVTQRSARDVARAAAKGARDVAVSVSGSEILLSGPPDEVTAVKTLISQLDVPQSGSTYTSVYRLHNVDAESVANLLRRSFPGIGVQVDKDLNAVTVQAQPSVQTRIEDGIAQLDGALPGSAPGAAGAAPGGAGNEDVLTLRAAIPGQNGSPSTTASDIATTVQSMLSSEAPDLRIMVVPNTTQLILGGSPYAMARARALIEKLDVPQPIVVLDTEVLEVDESVAKQLGFKFPTAAITTTYSEIPPLANPTTGVAPALLGVQPLTRTPLSLGAELDFLIQNNNAKILENPRLTTLSGHTASLRAGETLNILTTTGGGTGTVATTQVQSFQTGVTLDITPVVNDGDYITVALHPSVNTLAGTSAGVPDIQTRDVTTMVGLRDGETIVIGGLIEEDTSRSVQKIPFLGDLPLVGALFRDTNLQYTRNELIVTVTPHILQPGESGQIAPSSVIPEIPRPKGLPTLAPGTTLPPRRYEETFQAQHRLAPAEMPAPGPNLTPPPTPAPSVAEGGAHPSTAPSAASTASAVPQAVPSAFNQINTFTYGAAPQNNYADSQQPPQIFFVQVQPTVVKSGQSMTISAITTTNVNRLTFGASAILPQISLASIGPGKWQSTFNFSTAGITALQGSVTLSLNAYSSLGATTAIPIPLSLVNQ
jgi:type II secretory pathway component GspD/PulD (secretin)